MIALSIAYLYCKLTFVDYLYYIGLFQISSLDLVLLSMMLPFTLEQYLTQGDIQIQFFRTKVSTYSGFDPIWTQLWYHASLPIATGIVLLSFYRKDNLLTDTQTAIAPNIQSHSVYLETDWHVCSFIVKKLNAGNVRW